MSAKRCFILVAAILLFLGFASNLLAQESIIPTINPTIAAASLWVALVLGTLIVLCILFIYFKKQKLGADGIVVLFVGVLFLGFSIWKQVEFSFGNIKFKAVVQVLDQVQAAQESSETTLAQLQSDQDATRQELNAISALADNPATPPNIRNALQPRIRTIRSRYTTMDGSLKMLRVNSDSTKVKLQKIRQTVRFK
jgi:hypothetical protein